MATELREAKIVVRLETQQSEEKVTTLEKRTEKVRRARQDMEDEERRDPSSGSPSAARIAARQAAHGQLYEAVTGLAKSVPVLGMIAAAGIGLAEANERFGPAVEGAVRELLPQAVNDALTATGLNPADLAREWSEFKAQLTSLSAAFDGVTNVAGAAAMTGGALSPADIANEFGLQREMAIIQIEILKARRRILQIRGGEGASRVIEQALSGSALPGSVGK
jgi:hypothetical protein